MKNIFRGIIILISVLFFNSCSNFLSGTDLKEKIDDVIEISKANELSVEINLKNKNSGSITPSGVNKVKKNVPFEIELSVKTGFYFNELFNLFEKSDGKSTKISNTSQLFKFVEKAKYSAGVGTVHYIYEITILNDTYPSILINPDIINLTTLKDPVITDSSIVYRYGDKSVVDYFDLHLYVEDESVPGDNIIINYLDPENNSPLFYTEEASVRSYPATIEDTGNGNYHIFTTIDLRNDSAFYDGINFKMIIKVKNRSNLYGSITYDKIFKKQSYSTTSIQLYNQSSTTYQSWFIGESLDNDGIKDISKFHKPLRLIIKSIDEDGLGLNKDGTKIQIKYGICQNKESLNSLELKNIISDYTAYDFNSEITDIHKIISFIHSEEYIPDEAGETYSQAINKTKDSMTEIFKEHEKKGIENLSIIDIPLPSNLDLSKDIFIKFSSENGINSQNSVVYTIPAAPSVLEINKTTDEENKPIINLDVFFHEADNINSFTFLFDPDTETWKKDLTSFYLPEYYADNSIPYSFYIGACFNEVYDIGIENHYKRAYYLFSINFNQYSTESIDERLIKFSEDAPVEITAGDLNSKLHTVSVQLDKNVFNQFEGVFVKYNENFSINNAIINELFLSENNKISFDVNSKYFLNYSGRIDFTFSLLGTKNGKSYITSYTIPASDSRIKDNVPPIIPLKLAIDWATMEPIYTNVVSDSTGSFITIEATPADVGNNLDELIPVTVKYTGKTISYNEEFTCTGLASKYLTLPVHHLKNGEYTLIVSITDKSGNTGYIDVDFKINRKEFSNNYKIQPVDENSFSLVNNSSKQPEYFNFAQFNPAENSWALTKRSPSDQYEKTGMLQVFANNQSKKDNDNYYNYPYLFHYPQQSVSVKDYQILRNSVHFYSDKPFFVHTIKSDIDWRNSAQDWENHHSFSYTVSDSNYNPFTGSEVNPCYITENHSASPYIYTIPWDQLDKKYAAVVVIWNDNTKYLIPLDMTLKD